MLTYEDCLALVELTPEQVAVIADRLHVPQMVALELGSHLCESRQGELRIKRMIMEAIEAAHARGDRPGAARLRLVLREFIDRHPRVH